MRRVIVTLLLLVMGPGAGWSQPVMPMRIGNHPGFGRIVFDASGRVEFDLVEQGSRILVVFRPAHSVGPAPGLPRNVLAINEGEGAATLTVVPGAKARASRAGDRIVIDVLDPAATPAAKPRGTRAPTGRTMPPPVPTDIVPTTGAVSPAAVPEPARSTMPSPPKLPEPIPVAKAPPSPVPGTVLIPAAPTVGAALLRRAAEDILVLDERVTIDAAALQAVAGPSAAPRLLPGATVVTLPHAPDRAADLRREAEGWRLTVRANPAPSDAPAAAGPALDVTDPLRLGQPGRVITVLDESAGRAVLVLTSLSHDDRRATLVAPQRRPEFTIVPTSVGVAIEPQSDQVELRAGTAGGVVAIRGVALSPDMPAASPAEARVGHRFDFPPLGIPALLQRLAAQTNAAAVAPPRDRTRERLGAAQSLISLGMGAEASGVLSLIAADDPAAAAGPDVTALAAIAAVLAGRAAEASGLADTRLDGEEVTLWRGIRDVALMGRSAIPIGQMLPIVMGYPAPLRDRLAPIIREAGVMEASSDALPGLLKAMPADPAFAYARAVGAARLGDTPLALRLLDGLAREANRWTEVRAREKATELRLETGAVTPAQAADELERVSLAWRGDEREVALRLRVAALRAQSGAWRAALEGLRDVIKLAPENQADAVRDVVRTRTGETFRRMLDEGAPAVSPVDFVALASDFAEGLPTGAAGQALQGMLADKLLALELPLRARSVLQALVQSTPAGPVRAGIGVRLAQMLVESGADAQAQTVLLATQAADLPGGLTLQRRLLDAKIRAGQGDVAGAIARLGDIATAEADEQRATLMARAGDWPGSLTALSQMVERAVPASGSLTPEQQALLLRQASAAVQAGDHAALRDLHRRYADRMVAPNAAPYRLLTALPVMQSSDLPRAGQEIALARALPAALAGNSR